ncbi:hypothetical protein BPOR_0819g00060 [Botrytis porri]|uniref:Uncharacterized protein n=1 Tax=Botrytis porri TaxID=87229 RepID=A0A4Z1KG15_9HELO|nr:hypothetical protein BPOR_0819g00060 [Botrytis porri]
MSELVFMLKRAPRMQPNSMKQKLKKLEPI